MLIISKMIWFCLIGNNQFAAVIHGVVLHQREDDGAVGGEVGHHVKLLADDDLSVEDVVVGIIAMVDYIREFNHKASGVALAVSTGIGVVGRDAVVGQKLVVAQFIDDDASAGALDIGRQVEPSADEVQFLILQRVGVDGDGGREDWPDRVLWKGMASVEKGQERH